MKIAFIGQKGVPAIYGGVERHVEELAVQLAGMGHTVFVYARKNYSKKEELKEYRGVKIIYLPSIPTKHLDAISHTFFASLHALFSDYDIVHYQSIGPSLLSWIIKYFKRDTLVVSTFHCQDYHHQKWNWFARMSLRIGEYISCKIPDRTIVISESLKAHVWKKYKRRAICIPNGSKATPDLETDQLGKWELKDRRYIFCASRLIKHKGIHYLIEAFKQLEDTNKLPNNFKLVIAGDGSHTEDYVRYLKNISKGRRNIIFTGSQSGKSLNQLFTHAYLFVQPSESEGLSIALLEAMGYGLPILVSNIEENMKPLGDAGFSFKNGNIDDLVNKLAYLLNRSDEILKFGKKAKEKAEKEFSWKSIARKTDQVYREAIK